MNPLAQWMATNYAKKQRGPKTRTGGLSPRQAAKILSKAIKRPISLEAVRKWQNGTRTTPADVLQYIQRETI